MSLACYIWEYIVISSLFFEPIYQESIANTTKAGKLIIC